jgi:hypothetical protein
VNSEVALTYAHWQEAMRILSEHPDATHNEKELALMVRSLIDINRYDPETITYINEKAEQFMEASEQ